MPKRSNAFQQLIYSIQHSVSKQSTVTESKYLTDRQTGKQVEVDIVIEAIVNDIPVIVSVEVRDRTRAATVEWVRESIGKHATLPTNKLVLVSRTGFTKEAIVKAQQNGIEALTLEKADAYSWSHAVNKLGKEGLMLTVFELSWQTYTVGYTSIYRDDNEITINQDSLNECVFTNSTNGEARRLQDVPGVLLNDAKVVRPIIQRWIHEEKDDFVITWNVPQDSTLTDEFGNVFKIEFIKIFGKSRVKREPLQFSFNKFQNSKVAHASVRDIVSKISSGGEITLTIIDRDGQDPVASITLPKQDELGRRVLAMEKLSNENA